MYTITQTTESVQPIKTRASQTIRFMARAAALALVAAATTIAVQAQSEHLAGRGCVLGEDRRALVR